MTEKRRLWKLGSGTDIELHAHSTASIEDPKAAVSPERLVAIAHQQGVRVLALQDHNTFGGVPSAIEAGEKHGVFVIPGTAEISTVLRRKGKSDYYPHLLVFYGTAKTTEHVSNLIERTRLYAILRSTDFLGIFAERGLVYPHYALKAMSQQDFNMLKRRVVLDVWNNPRNSERLRELGFESQDALLDSVLQGRKPFRDARRITRSNIDARDFIKAIKNAGGYVVLAHPGGKRPINDAAILSLVEAGLDGIEVAHPQHAPEETIRLMALAEKRGLDQFYGSDFHGLSVSGVPNHFFDSVQLIYQNMRRLKGVRELTTRVLEDLERVKGKK